MAQYSIWFESKWKKEHYLHSTVELDYLRISVLLYNASGIDFVLYVPIRTMDILWNDCFVEGIELTNWQ